MSSTTRRRTVRASRGRRRGREKNRRRSRIQRRRRRNPLDGIASVTIEITEVNKRTCRGKVIKAKQKKPPAPEGGWNKNVKGETVYIPRKVRDGKVVGELKVGDRRVVKFEYSYGDILTPEEI